MKIKFFCINLDKNHNRWKTVQGEFKKAGLNVERFSGISNEEFGYYGCTLSHKKILETAKAEGYQAICVFEDDIFFHKPETINNEIIQSLAAVPNNWRLIYLGGLIGRNSRLKKINKLIYKVDYFMCTYGIIYNHTSYDEILANMPTEYARTERETYMGPCKTYDDWLANYYQLKFPCYINHNILVSERDGFSEIEKKYKTTRKKYTFRFLLYKYGMGRIAKLMGIIGDVFGFSDRKKQRRHDKFV